MKSHLKISARFLLIGLIIIFEISTMIFANKNLHQNKLIKDLPNSQINLQKNLRRYKRQFDHVSPNSPQIDLNITVPYIFSARLYPYGTGHGDSVSISEDVPQKIHLKYPLTFLEKTYDTIYIHHDGIISMNSEFSSKNIKSLPIVGQPIIPVFWQNSRGGKIFARETTDSTILNLAQSEVNIQYRYGNDFQTISVIIITWEELMREKDEKINKNGNIFQIALILGENACFGHIVYSKLQYNNNAIAGFNGGNDAYFSMPGSGTTNVIQLLDKSNIGIPGEWLFRIDEERIYLCGAGFQGLECVDSCAPTQWYLDCSRQCHCADSNPCNVDTGDCPNSKCNPGWQGAPICDQDIDECTEENVECPNEQPDCVNTPGAYLCLCFEYDRETNTCKSSPKVQLTKNNKSEQIPVPIMPLVPLLAMSTKMPTTTIKKFIIKNPEDENSLSFSTSSVILTPENIAGSVVSDGIRKIPLASFFDAPTSQTAEILPNEMTQTVRNSSTPTSLTIRPILGGRQLGFGTTKNKLITVPPQSFSSKISPSTSRVFGRDRPSTELPCQNCHNMARCLNDGKCECVPGWVGDGQNCEDLNECTTQNACGQNAECQNTLGSYQCVCNVGFVAASHGCVDVDECAEDMVQCRGGNTSICVNTMGGYECKCRNGFTGSPDSPDGCLDINECELSNYYCGDKATCQNLPGSYSCICFEGYEKQQTKPIIIDQSNGLTSSNMGQLLLNQCVDMNECEHNPCHSAAKCTNLHGTFQCECNSGYIGDGIECHETILYPISRNAITIISNGAPQPIQLDIPLILFGKTFSTIYISNNGLIAFDKSAVSDSETVVKNPQEIRSTNLLPLHLAYNPISSGSITLQIVAENNFNDNDSILTKASMNIQDKFHVDGFKATILYIITYERMHEMNIEKPNTFQVVIAQNNNSTYVIYLYENLESLPRGIAGISSPLGFIGIPSELLVSSSNVGQAGKWIFRVDEPTGPVQCPAGTIGAPLCQQDCHGGTWGFGCLQQCKCADRIPCDFRNGFCSNNKCELGFTGQNCQQDIDECAQSIHKCHKNATCHNTIGGYTCKCNLPQFDGNGFFCEAVDACLERFGRECAFNAHCDTSNVDYPECICNENFNGDGRRNCSPNNEITELLVSTTTTISPPYSPSSLTITTKLNQQKIKETFSASNEQNPPPFTFLDENVLNNGIIQTNSKNQLTTTTTIKTTTIKKQQEKKPTIKIGSFWEKNNTIENIQIINNNNNNNNNNIQEKSDDDLQNIGGKAEEETSGSYETSGMVILMISCIIFAIWVILAATLGIVFCCRKRRTRVDKYSPQMMGWSPRDYTNSSSSNNQRNSYFSQFTYT